MKATLAGQSATIAAYNMVHKPEEEKDLKMYKLSNRIERGR